MNEKSVANPSKDGGEAYQVQVVRLYARDISLEIPHAPECFLKERISKEDHTLDLDNSLNFHAKEISEEVFEVVAQLKAVANLKDEVLYILEVQFAGLFLLRGEGEKESKLTFLKNVASSVLLPYLSELAGNISARTSFPPITLTNVITGNAQPGT